MGGARVTTLVTLRKCTLGNKREIKTLKFVSASTKGFKGGLAWIKPSKKDMAVTFSYLYAFSSDFFPETPEMTAGILAFAPDAVRDVRSSAVQFLSQGLWAFCRLWTSKLEL